MKLTQKAAILNLGIGLALAAAALAAKSAGLSPAITLGLLSILTILPTIFGDGIEKALLRNTDPAHLPWFAVRETVLPAATVAGCLLAGWIAPQTLLATAWQKADIIILILSFALIADGLRQSGYFRYAAFRVLEVCEGNARRLTLYLFLLSSILTYFTSNDIVILIMTPIIMALCAQSGLKNARLLLLGQFVAANTLSMGLLIGSPTNVIVSSEIEGMDFLRYWGLMTIPAVLAAAASFLVLHNLNLRFPKKIRTWLAWDAASKHHLPALKDQPELTGEMRAWQGFFALVVIAIAWISGQGLPFFWITIPAALLALAGAPARIVKASPRTETFSPKEAMKALPLQIIAFAICFFTIAETLSQHLDLKALMGWLTSDGLWETSMRTMALTTGLVNSINDLPAAAMMGKVVQHAGGLTEIQQSVFMQSMLASLNIACYLTPVGALAGIIWFHIMKQESTRLEQAQGIHVETPTRAGLCIYGAAHLFLTSLILSVLIPFSNLLVQQFTNQQWTADLLPGAAILAMVAIGCRRILTQEQVAIGDVRAFLSAATWVQTRSSRAGIPGILAIAFLILVAYTTASGQPLPVQIEDLQAFAQKAWQTGRPFLYAAPMVLVWLLFRFLQKKPNPLALSRIRLRIAKGEVIVRRRVVIDPQPFEMPCIEAIQERGRIFQTLLFPEGKPQQAETDLHHAGAELSEPIALARAWNLERADEISLLGSADPEKSLQGLRRVLNLSRLQPNREPEETAGRMPRIFVWESLPEQPGMEPLLIRLPDALRNGPETLKRVIAGTQDEKSWKQRRLRIQEALSSA